MLRQQLSDSLKESMKAKDSCTTATVRLILAALKDRDIQARGNGDADGIDNDGILGLLQSMVKQRRESIEAYRAGGRQDLSDQEAAEIEVIQRFLPTQLDDQETADAVAKAIAKAEATTLKDMGKVMTLLKETYPGRMDFSKASTLVKQHLG